MHANKNLRAFLLTFAAMGLTCPVTARCQSYRVSEQANIHLSSTSQLSVCREIDTSQEVKAALRLACLRERLGGENVALTNVIVIGFVGGFVRSDDVKHPEVQFAVLLRQSYPSIHAEVFANHDGKTALRRVLDLLDTNGDGVLTSGEKEEANIIIYGHSWGASQAVTLAYELGQLGIPVLLTVQVDSVRKRGRQDSIIPSNVRNAVNFYQTKGFIHGLSHIRAADPERTNIIGNFQMTYQDRQIKVDNYPWLARHLNKGHHEIENDPRVWEQIASLIDSEVLQGRSALEASLPFSSPPLK